MELISFLLMIAVPLAFLIYGFTFKGYLRFITIPPILFMFIAIASLNADPVITVIDVDCDATVTDTVATNLGNGTTTTNYDNAMICQQTSTDHNLDPNSLQMINYSMLVGMLSVVATTGIRMLNKAYSSKTPDE